MGSSYCTAISAKFYRTPVIPLLFMHFGSICSHMLFLYSSDRGHYSLAAIFFKYATLIQPTSLIIPLPLVNCNIGPPIGKFCTVLMRVILILSTQFWTQMSAFNFQSNIKYIWKLCQTFGLGEFTGPKLFYQNIAGLSLLWFRALWTIMSSSVRQHFYQNLI